MYNTWQHPYEINPAYSRKVAYLSMEIAVDQPLKIYSGGLGFLAGSHMRSAHDLGQNMVGITIRWSYGYYDQDRADDQTMQARFRIKDYTFLKDTGIVVTVPIKDYNVRVKVYALPSETFETAPIYLLSTDIPENESYYRRITHRLYDADHEVRIMQYMVLGIGGAKTIEALGGADVYHLNEAHALPLAFYFMSRQDNDPKSIQKKLVFTTHTPEEAGNESFDYGQLGYLGYFSGVPVEQVKELTHNNELFGSTPAALVLSKMANAVSQLHGEVSRRMWKDIEGACPIKAITNAQNVRYWRNNHLYELMEAGDLEGMQAHKRTIKKDLFEVVADQTGKLFREDVLTIVWARRFAAYKRANLLLRDINRFKTLLHHTHKEVQVIWAGKPYPEDNDAVNIFNTIVEVTREQPNAAILTGYELHLSRLLKMGADIWLNTPRRTREASGTSGMTAAMNGAINCTIDDGWVPEFGKDGENCFIIPSAKEHEPVHVRDLVAFNGLYEVLEKKVVPLYYDKPMDWQKLVVRSMTGVLPFFDSDRMAREYYEELYDYEGYQE